MNKQLLLAVVGALALVSLPAAAKAAQPPPCEIVVYTPCMDGQTLMSSSGQPVALQPSALRPMSHALTPAELSYHRETTANIERTWNSAASAAPAAQTAGNDTISPRVRDQLDAAPRPYDGGASMRNTHTGSRP